MKKKLKLKLCEAGIILNTVKGCFYVTIMFGAMKIKFKRLEQRMRERIQELGVKNVELFNKGCEIRDS